MVNLTEAQKVVIVKGLDVSLEIGYDLVVIDDNQFKLYHEGRLPEKKGWLSFQTSKVSNVYAVSTDDRHEVSFKKPVSHSDGLHDFFVNITVRFGVSDPVSIVKNLRRDPVGKLKEETGRVIVGFLRSSNWSDIRDSNKFSRLKSSALDQFILTGRSEAVPMFDRISEHADNYGLKLSELNFDVTIAEEDLVVEKRKEELDKEKVISTAKTIRDLHVKENEHKVNYQDKNYEGQIRDLERKEVLKDQATKTTGNFLDTVGKTLADNTRSLGDVNDMLSEVQRIQGLIQGGGTGPSSFTPLGRSNVGQLAAGNNLVQSVLEIITEIKGVKLDLNTQKILLGSLFKIVGGKLLGESDEEMDHYLLPLSGVEINKGLQEYIMEKLKDIKNKIENGQIL